MTDKQRPPSGNDPAETEDPNGQPQHGYLPDGTPVEDEAGPGIAIDDDSVPPARGPETEHS